jgi:hypothetical protein
MNEAVVGAVAPSFDSLLRAILCNPTGGPRRQTAPHAPVPISSQSHAPIEPLRNASSAPQAVPAMQHTKSIALLLVLAFAGAQASVVDTVADTPELTALLAAASQVCQGRGGTRRAPQTDRMEQLMALGTASVAGCHTGHIHRCQSRYPPSHCCCLPPSPVLLLQSEDILVSLGDDFSGTAFLPSNKVSAPVGWPCRSNTSQTAVALLQYRSGMPAGAAACSEWPSAAGRCPRASYSPTVAMLPTRAHLPTHLPACRPLQALTAALAASRAAEQEMTPELIKAVLVSSHGSAQRCFWGLLPSAPVSVLLAGNDIGAKLATFCPLPNACVTSALTACLRAALPASPSLPPTAAGPHCPRHQAPHRCRPGRRRSAGDPTAQQPPHCESPVLLVSLTCLPQFAWLLVCLRDASAPSQQRCLPPASDPAFPCRP